MTALLLVHGRSQQMAKELGRAPDDVTRYVLAKKRDWLAGLAKGLVLAGHQPLKQDLVYFPFYGNDLADRIATHETSGKPRPDLELGGAQVDPTDLTSTIGNLSQDLLIDSAQETGFVPGQSADLSPELREQIRKVQDARQSGEELNWSAALKATVARSALQHLANKTGTADWIIEQFLRDVAYYLADDDFYTTVQTQVKSQVTRAINDGHTDLIVVGHSLGSVVAYDACTDLSPEIAIRLLVTAGSPLGQRVVRRNLRGPGKGSEQRQIPAAIKPRDAAPPLRWLNAYDVLDVVSLIHPIGQLFTANSEELRDERTFNPSGAHAIQDYLSDPDVAGPIAAAMRLK